jgi:hypothetical protein
MGGGVKRNRVALPKGHDRGGDEQQPGDEVVGAWSRQQREKMDQAFAERMERALRQHSARRRDDGSR